MPAHQPTAPVTIRPEFIRTLFTIGADGQPLPDEALRAIEARPQQRAGPGAKDRRGARRDLRRSDADQRRRRAEGPKRRSASR